jgi:hypothetical protein
LELILHIGHEKTGTSSIQESLFQNKRYLQSLDVVIPTEFGVGNARLIPAMFSSLLDDYFERKGLTQSNLTTTRDKYKKEFDTYLNGLPKNTKLDKIS